MTINSNSLFSNKKKNINKVGREPKSLNIGLTREQLLLKGLKNIAQEYIEIEKLKRNFSNAILKNLKELDFSEFIRYPKYYIKEKHLKKITNAGNLSGINVVSVDGSSVVKKMINSDFVFLKAIAVKYHFYEDQDADIHYFPDISGFNNYSVHGNYVNCQDDIVDNKTAMDMTLMEIKLLNDLIQKSSDIDLIIIDGSIVIMPINLIFSTNREISMRYDTLLKEYHELYSNCKEKGIILIGSIKDTRTSALTHLLRDSIQLLKPTNWHLSDFININYRQVIDYFSDLDLFDRLLSVSERSCIFNCKREVDKIRDTGIKKKIPYYFPLSFYAFYLKTAQFDAPCRIEFFTDETDSFKKASEKADLISSILLPMSSLNLRYGLPIPQIEAHRRAVFKPGELELLFNNIKRILSGNGFTLIEKRRNRRPF